MHMAVKMVGSAEGPLTLFSTFPAGRLMYCNQGGL